MPFFLSPLRPQPSDEEDEDDEDEEPVEADAAADDVPVDLDDH